MKKCKKISNRIVGLWVLALVVGACAPCRYKLPAAVSTGDTIGIISMSSRVDSLADTAAVARLIDSMGYRVLWGAHLLDQWDPSFGADDRTRAEELNRMMKNPAVKAVLLYKGGYGAVRTLDDIDWRAIRRHPKWIAGYSDVTMLHLAAQKRRIQTIHADMPVTFSNDSVSVPALFDALSGRLDTIRVAPHPLNQYGTARGRMVGGNLSILYSATGTPEEKALKKKGNVLFIEEVGEKLYHIDRMFQNLERSGILSRCSAIVIGHFTGIAYLERFGVETAEELVSRYTRKYNIPVVFGMPAGHAHPNLALYMGRGVSVEVDSTGALIRFLK